MRGARRIGIVTMGGFSFLLAVPTSADLNDCATDWSNFNSPGFISEYTYLGQIVADEETSADTSHGPAAVTPRWTDLASGSPGSFPGPEPTAFFGYYNGSTPYDPTDPSTMEDDFILFRMRVEGDPRTGAAFDSKHWNVLFDVDADGYKEYWVDLDGSYHSGQSPDRIQVLYDNNNRQDIPDPDAARVDAFTAYHTADGNPSCPAGSPGLSHTRVININDGTGDFWIEMQVPMTAFNDSSGNQVLFPDSPVAFVFSTGASNQDPLQKDWMHDLDFLSLNDPITFGDVILPNGRPILEFTDASLTFVTFYAIGDDVYLYVKDPMANEDSNAVDCIMVTVTNPATGDDENVTLCESGPATGIFTNQGGACKPAITNPDPPPDPPTAWIPAVRTSSTTLEEDWTLTYDGANGNWIVSGSVSQLQTGRATAGTPYTSDDGEISFTLYQNSPANGTELSFCTRAADPLATSSTAGVDDDGTLQVFSGDQITVSYTSVNFPTVTDTATIVGPCEAFIDFTRANGLPAEEFELTTDPATSDRLYVTVNHREANTNPAVAETIQVVLTGNDTQTLTLTETGPNTGEFRNTSGLATKIDDGTVTPEDNLWEDIDAGTVTATYNYNCGGSPFTVDTQASLFYIDAAGRVYFTDGTGTSDVEIYGANQPVFIKVTDELACAVGGTLQVTVTSPRGDSETLTLYETFTGSGVYMNRKNDLVTTESSPIVTSASSTFLTDGVAPGDTFIIATGPDAGSYTVASVNSETQITLTVSLTSTRTGIGFNATPLMTATYDGTVAADDNLLEASHQDALTVSYDDCDDGDSDPLNDVKTDTASYNQPQLLINEVLFYPDTAPSSCQTEGIELYNPTTAAINATGYTVADEDGFSYTVPRLNGSDIVLAPGETIFLSLWDSSPPADFYSGGIYFLFTSAGSSYPADRLADPASSDPADQVSLYDPAGVIQDYVGWSATLSPSIDFYGDDSPAVLRPIWQDDAFRNVAGIPLGYSIARSSDGFDTNQPGDWVFAQNSTCQIIITRAFVSSFRAVRQSGHTLVEWETSSEDAALGFVLFRLDPRRDRWVQVNQEMLPALLDSPQGGIYRVNDEGGPRSGSATYALLEIEALAGGTERTWYGPFTVEVVDRMPSGRQTVSSREQAAAHSLTPAQAERLRAGAREQARVRASRGLAGQPRRGEPVRDWAPGRKIKISVVEEGLYFLQSGQVATLTGVPDTVIHRMMANRLLRLTNRGRDVAWAATADRTGILFWGQPIDSLYTRENIYWLQMGRGVEMGVVSGSGPSPTQDPGTYRDTVHAEEDAFPATLVARDPESDYWFWKYVASGHPIYGKQSLGVRVEGLSERSTDPATLKVHLYGANDGVHHVEVSLNGVPIGGGRWQGMTGFTAGLPVDPGLLEEGENSVEVRGVLDTGAPFDIFYIDSIDLSYERSYRAVGDRLIFRTASQPVITVTGFSEPSITVLELTDPRSPRRVEAKTIDSVGGGYRVSFRPSSHDAVYIAETSTVAKTPMAAWMDEPSRLRSRANAADYLVISPAELKPAAARLAALRSGRGLQTKVVGLEDVMDEFNHGLSSPHALRAFLSFAFQNWRRPPRYVVLAGAGTLDYRNNWGLGGNLVPTLMVSTPNGLYASDNRLADVNEDGLPDMAVGRIPALTAAELEAYTEKLRAYESASSAPWRDKVVLAADNNPTGEGNFTRDSDSMATFLPRGTDAEKIYLSELPARTAHQELLAGVREGAGLLNYVGHGGLDRMADEVLLQTSDVAPLDNGEKLPIVTGFTCSINRFEVPGFPSLGEVLTLDPDGGAAAVWAPSGLSLDTEARTLGGAFFRAAFDDRLSVLLGDVVLRSCRDYVSRGGEVSLVDVYNLLGDPAIEMR